MWLGWRKYITGDGLWEFKGPSHFQYDSLCFMLVVQDVSSGLAIPASMPTTLSPWTLPLWNDKPK